MRVLGWFAGMRRAHFAAGVLLICALECAACLALSVEGRHQVLGAIDGRVYNQLGINLADHGSFSEAPTAPFSPSVFRTPGYPAMLALLRLVFGGSLVAVRITQFALIAVTALLVWITIARLSSEFAGRTAGVLSVTYLPLLWLAREHISDVLCTAIAAAAVAVLVRALTTPAPRARVWYVLLGVLGAAGSMVRPEFAAVMALIAICVLIWPGATGRGQAVGSIAAMLAAMVVLLVPWAVRNYDVTHRFVPFGTASGTSLYASVLQWSGTVSMQFNNADFRADIARTDALVGPVQAADRLHHRSPAHTEVAINDALTTAARSLAGHLTAGGVLSRTPKRLVYLWSVADEPPPGAYSLWHDVDRIQYLVLLVLVLAGLIASWRGRRRGRSVTSLWPLFVFAVALTAVHMVFSEQPRYSMPARPWLIGIAGIGIAALAARAGLALHDGAAPPVERSAGPAVAPTAS